MSVNMTQLSALMKRQTAINSWLKDNAPETWTEQRHLDQDTVECAYWHHGYQAALGDIITLLLRATGRRGSADTLN
jgi:hypothetical protein